MLECCSRVGEGSANNLSEVEFIVEAATDKTLRKKDKILWKGTKKPPLLQEFWNNSGMKQLKHSHERLGSK